MRNSQILTSYLFLLPLCYCCAFSLLTLSVALNFHPGTGKTIEIYDGRKSLKENQVDTQKTSVEKVDSGKGEIIYFRDSDDEMPDSDEDPDDDLDI